MIVFWVLKNILLISSVAFYIFNVATRKVKNTYVTCIIFLLNVAVLSVA